MIYTIVWIAVWIVWNSLWIKIWFGLQFRVVIRYIGQYRDKKNSVSILPRYTVYWNNTTERMMTIFPMSLFLSEFLLPVELLLSDRPIAHLGYELSWNLYYYRI